ncbi:hypothetical protein PENTCL1PPCAC_9850 [Pristionchus entomophagus]|uniref:Uncharacterized protein n=1 Tax=Pristionchus entomophagus TaxID=358040 RepID=A0AAV5T5S0_9BILA|nr:hypothetical protein PENTCL1PPCAC_9850 [Pristionchus entomophagus]
MWHGAQFAYPYVSQWHIPESRTCRKSKHIAPQETTDMFCSTSILRNTADNDNKMLSELHLRLSDSHAVKEMSESARELIALEKCLAAALTNYRTRSSQSTFSQQST